MPYGNPTQEEIAASDARIMVWVKRILVILAAALALILVVVFVAKLVNPQLRLYQANTEKKAAIAEAKAREASAIYLANAEVTRANGVAQANRIIADSITPEYNQWLYIENLGELAAKSGATVIYVPTEGGIPVTEAGRAAAEAAKE